MTSRQPFETVQAARRAAKRRLPAKVFSLLGGGNQAGASARANVEIFNHVHLRPRVCAALQAVDASGTMFGRTSSLPVAIAPVAAQGVAPAAELAQARACAKAGVPLGVSNFASVPWRELAAAGAEVWAQLYWVGGREDMALRLRTARAAGVETIILTVDWSFPAGRDWGTPAIPQAMGWKQALQWAPAALRHPGWSIPLLASGTLPPLRVPNFAREHGPLPTFAQVMQQWRATSPPTWDDISWLRSQWAGNLVVKGIMEPADATRAMAAGADAVGVSNHGGNDLDTVAPSLAALPGVVAALEGRIPVIFDGGIRRGADVLKALALGASSVMVGRSAVWATAARGASGLEEILGVFNRDIHQTMTALGAPDLSGIARHHVLTDQYFDALSEAFLEEASGHRNAVPSAGEYVP